MSGGFIAQPDPSPRSIASGESVVVTLHYKYTRDNPGDPDPEVKISCSPTFKISWKPDPATLPPANNGEKKVTIKIEREAGTQSPDECTLTFEALNDERNTAVTVKR